MQIVINLADFFILGVLAYFTWRGFKSGLYESLLDLFGFFSCLTLTLILLPYFAQFFSYVVELPPNMSVLLGFTFLFALLALAYLFFVKWIKTMIQMTVNEKFNRVTGTGLGLYRGVLLASLLMLGFTLLPIPRVVQGTQARSLLMARTKMVLPLSYDYVRKLIPGPPGFRQALQAAYKRIGGLDPVSERLLDELPGKPPPPNVSNY
ncbi:MAG: CvpA family protein [candidate division KSB1 bacterium]|nr:CvpA family protein [candidate division KSB1 bacterium]MDZ7275693.1 CvpA family protein [candidate division KSB1 bacterium]MDZ7284616.1 CvpA family protein [candidate division KSB1 bacterium]MDZ7297965.1 CvpA family protein [candidate division KSB1 bacterium]MDZ7305867.1 CvpA family protein [candidate division KSB1 bacterium]